MRIYAYEDGGKKHLVALECDDCGARIKPGPDIAESGWVKAGCFKNNHDPSYSFEYAFCPSCAGHHHL